MVLLLVVLLLGIALTVTTSGGSGPLPLDTTGSSTGKGRVQSVVEVLQRNSSRKGQSNGIRVERHRLWTREIGTHLLRVQSDDERRNVDHLLSDTDVPLPDKDTGVVDGLGETGRTR